MSKVHFFIDPTGLSSQNASQCFGSTSSTEFRVTSSFTISGSPNAYAICKGRVLIQQQSGTGNNGKVNLVLKPYNQPIEGLNIKYFIYRGLDKDDFFTSGSPVTVNSGTSGNTDLINAVNKAYLNFHNQGVSTSPPAFDAKFIGFNTIHDGTDLLDDLFFKESTEAKHEFELPMVRCGMSLGKFVGTNCGIDVVLNHGNYIPDENDLEFKLDLDYARLSEAKITLSGTYEEKKVQREQCFQFLDIAAFYGHFHGDLVGIEWGGVTIDPMSNAMTLNNANKIGDDIYNDLLDNKFHSKNRIYVYLQSDRGRSYNFYENYFIEGSTTDSLKRGEETGVLNDNIFGDSNDWPIIIDDTARASNTNSMNRLFLQLTTNNAQTTCLYQQIGGVGNTLQNDFISPKNLLQEPDNDGNLNEFTNEIEIATPAVGLNSVASFNLLYYYGNSYSYKVGETTDDQNNVVDILETPNLIDDVLDLINVTGSHKNDEDSSYSVVTSLKYKLLPIAVDDKLVSLSMVQSSIIRDTKPSDDLNPAVERVTYIADIVDTLKVRNVLGSFTKDTSITTVTATNTNHKNIYQLPEPYFYEMQILTESYEEINALKLYTRDNSEPQKLIVGFTKDENDEIEDIITSNNLRNVRLFFVDLFDKGGSLISMENIEYKKFKLGIVGEKPNGAREQFFPSTNLLIYSIDNLYFFTSNYSNSVDAVVNDEFMFELDTKISL